MLNRDLRIAKSFTIVAITLDFLYLVSAIFAIIAPLFTSVTTTTSSSNVGNSSTFSIGSGIADILSVFLIAGVMDHS
jgi:hypothetical protein